MLSTKLKASVAAVALLGGLSIGSPANATTVDPAQRGIELAEMVFASSNPGATLDALSAADKQLFRDANIPVRAEVTTTTPVRVPGRLDTCWAWTANGVYKSLLNITLFVYGNSVEECHYAGTSRSVEVFNVYTEIRGPGWREERSPRTGTQLVSYEARGLSQHYLVFGGGGVDVNRPTACLQQRLNANGRDRRAMLTCNLSAP